MEGPGCSVTALDVISSDVSHLGIDTIAVSSTVRDTGSAARAPSTMQRQPIRG
jgi:hypothetical protein